MVEDHVNEAVNKSKRLEARLVEANARAEKYELMASWTENFIQSGKARINERG